MKIACEACGAKYTIADDKVRGRKVKIRCKGCGTPIVVDGQHGSGPSLSDAETEAALEPAEAPVIWSVNLSDTDSRTMSAEEIIQGYGSGLVTADAYVWKDGMADWVPLLESELAPLLGPAPAAQTGAEPAAAAAAAAMPLFNAPNQSNALGRPAARSPSQPDNTQDLFGGVDSAGAEEEVATSAPVIPQAGTSAYGDGSMTGARNENSVLFSLDALKAGFSPSAPAAKSSPKAPKAPAGGGRQQQISNPDDPFGMGSGSGLMNLGGPALFGADNQALLAAPVAPPPAPVVATHVAAAAAPAAKGPANNKLVLLLGAGGGIVIIGLLLALLLGRKHDETAPSAEGSASASASPAPESVPVTEAKKEEAPTPSAQPSAPAVASAAPAPSASPAAPSTSAPDTKHTDKAAGTVSKTGSTTPTTPAEPKKKEEPVAAGASDLPPFSKSSAISALTAASMSANACKKPGGPTGAGKATVTFAPSGRVTTATVAGGTYAGTAVGGCVASGFRKAHVPPFSGPPVTVSKSFQIN